MELSWLTRIKITAVLAVGVVIWGIVLWNYVAPGDPMGAVTLIGGRVSMFHLGIITLTAFGAGFFAYFVGWPYGREIGILAVPAGLAAWAARSSNMGELMQTHATVAERYSMYKTMEWDGFVWLAIAAAGYAGTVLASAAVPSSGVLPEFKPPKLKPQLDVRLAVVLAVAIAVGAYGMGVFAKDISFPDKRFVSVLGQPSNGQIAFAAVVSFGLAAFIVKRFWDASYIWPAISTAMVSFVSMNLCIRGDKLSYMASNWPALFFTKAIYAVLPIQIVSFGILGSITGHWLAVRFKYWQENHAK
jgi:hypothetical protein